MRQLFYYKMRQKFIKKCVSFIKKFDSYYKLLHFLQNASVHSVISVSLFASYCFEVRYPIQRKTSVFACKIC